MHMHMHTHTHTHAHTHTHTHTHPNNSLTDLLRDFAKEEPLDEGERPTCDGCKRKEPTSKMILIEKLPEVLVIHMKRFSYGTYRGKKITSDIRYVW
jgi:ubiquitin carboxyl-terminal hydrolase 2/21